MAISKENIITEGLSGMLGHIVFRTLNDKVIMANRPRKPTRESELQRANRRRFRNATAFAHAAMKDPEKKAYYWDKARKLKLPNAYTAAITDYMRRPSVSKVDAAKGSGKANGTLIITAGKKEFSLASVEVKLVNKEGASLGSSPATLKKSTLKKSSHNEWIYTPPVPLSIDVAELVVTAKDTAGNVTTMRHLHLQNDMLVAA